LIASFMREAQTGGGGSCNRHHAQQRSRWSWLDQRCRSAVLENTEELPLTGIDACAAGLTVTALPPRRRAPAQWANGSVKVGLTGRWPAGPTPDDRAAESTASTALMLPETHIALLPSDRLYPTMASFFAANSAQSLVTEASNLVFITGPSRTADIEMIITRGVHGPKRLCVVLLP
jgi:hypothetical protein